MKVSSSLTTKDFRHFGLIMGIMIALIFGAIIPWFCKELFRKIPLIIGAVFITWAFVAPITLKPLYRIWMLIGSVLGWINTRIILIFLFYLVFTPMGLVMKCLRRDAMNRKWNPDTLSYRQSSDQYKPQHMERPF